MNANLLFWIYLVNTVILINHEIDSAYWQEWKLLHSLEKIGIKGFLILHIPLVFIVLLGLVLVYEGIFVGYLISLLLSVCGMFAFFFHFHFLQKGRQEFNTPVSKGLIVSTALMSVFQVVLTIREMM